MSEKNGRASLRDLMNLQTKMNDKLDKINDRITNLAIRLALISGGIAVLVTIATNLIF